jgi:hypothetical protein
MLEQCQKSMKKEPEDAKYPLGALSGWVLEECHKSRKRCAAHYYLEPGGSAAGLVTG